jgi:micrococcal nuclease
MARVLDVIAITIGLLLIAGCTAATDQADEPTPVTTTTPVSRSPTTTPVLAPTGETISPTSESHPGRRVVRVLDGDTLVLEGGERVRLIGIDAPEASECFGDEATSRLRELVEDREIRLERQKTNRGPYERLLRDVYVGDAFINELLVRDGFARASPFGDNRDHELELEAAEEAARRNGAGLWSACQDLVQCLSFSELQFNASGNDNENLNGEWVRITSSCPEQVDLTGWVLRDESASHRFRFPTGFALAPSASVTVFTGCGTSTDVALYWCNQGSAIWNNDGDTATLLNAEGKVVTSRSY